MSMQAIVTTVTKKEAKLPSEYESFKVVFEPDDSLPKHGKHDHVIPLEEGKSPWDMLRKGYI